MQKDRTTYVAPTITIVEAKACAKMCTASSNSLVVMLGSDSSTLYGVQNYEAGGSLGW